MNAIVIKKSKNLLNGKIETVFTGATGVAAISGVTLLDAAYLVQYTLQIIVAGLTIYYLIKKNKSHDKTAS